MNEIKRWYENAIEAEVTYQLPYYENIDAKVTFNQDGYISILNVVLDWSGGAHPHHYENGLTYNISTAKQIASSTEFLQGNMQNIRELLSYCFEVAAETSTEEWQIDSMLQDTPFVLKENGLCYYFNVGDAVLRIEVVIPFNRAHSIMISCDTIVRRISENDTKKRIADIVGYDDAISFAGNNKGGSFRRSVLSVFVATGNTQPSRY